MFRPACGADVGASGQRVQEGARDMHLLRTSQNGEILRLSSLKEQKRMKNYKSEFKVYSDPETVIVALKWIRATQSPYGSILPANAINISSDVHHDQPMLHSKF